MTELVFYEDAYRKQCDAQVLEVGEGGIVLDRTVFYPMGGGQPGDTGALSLADGTAVTISDTRRRKDDGAVIHVPADDADVSALREGAAVVACIDWARRYAHMRIHTCLHLLFYDLRWTNP